MVSISAPSLPRLFTLPFRPCLFDDMKAAPTPVTYYSHTADSDKCTHCKRKFTHNSRAISEPSMPSAQSRKRKSAEADLPLDEAEVSTPTGSPVRKRAKITRTQKQALIDNLQLESTFPELILPRSNADSGSNSHATRQKSARPLCPPIL